MRLVMLCSLSFARCRCRSSSKAGVAIIGNVATLVVLLFAWLPRKQAKPD
jgi:hypothetical protein